MIPQKKLNIILLIGALPIIMAGAYLDATLEGYRTFWSYVYICTWEYMIFWLGMVVGVMVNTLSSKKIEVIK